MDILGGCTIWNGWLLDVGNLKRSVAIG